MIVLEVCVSLIDQTVVGTAGATAMYTRNDTLGRLSHLPYPATALRAERRLSRCLRIRRTTTTH